jgi:hypothetical protein
MLTPFIGLGKLGLGAWQMPFDCASAHLEDSGDLVTCELLKVAQDQEFTLIHAQPPERLPHVAPLRLLTVHVLWLAGRGTVQALGNQALMRLEDGLPAGPGASHFPAFFERDPIQPRFHGGVPTEVGQAFKRRQEDLLGDLTRPVLLKQVTRAVADDGILVLRDKELQRQGKLFLGDIAPYGCLLRAPRTIRAPIFLHVCILTTRPQHVGCMLSQASSGSCHLPMPIWAKLLQVRLEAVTVYIVTQER